MTTRGLTLVILSALLTVVANLLMRAGVDRAGGFPSQLAEIPSGLLRLLMQPLFDIGFVSYGISALIWFRVIGSEPLSTAYPLLVSITFMLVTLGAVILFKERITWGKVIGLLIILFGIFIIGKESS